MAYSGKTNWVNNEIVEAVDMNRIEQGITDLETGLGNAIDEVDDKVGSLATLATTDKTSVVNAINELDGNIDTLSESINTATTLEHTQSSSIQSLPTGTLDGVATNLEINGLSLVNSVVNGDFSDGTSGWFAGAATGAVGSKVYSLTGNGSAHNPTLGKSIGRRNYNGNKFFFYSKVKVTNALCTRVACIIGGTGVVTQTAKIQSNPVQNTNYELYKVLTLNDSFTADKTTYIYLEHRYADAAIANGKVMEIDGNAGVHAINMTALGIEDYTEAQMLDLVRGGYFDGLQSVDNPVVETVGKNLFDAEWFTNDLVANGMPSADAGLLDTGVWFNTITSMGSYISPMDFKPNTQYTLKATGVVKNYNNEGVYLTFGFRYTDGTTSVVTFTKNIYTTTVVSTAGKTVARLSVGWGYTGRAELTNIQLEEGTTATAYEPYKSSQLTANVPLRSLPNGVSDRVFVQDNEVWLEKNVEESAEVSGTVLNTTNLTGAKASGSFIAHQTDGTLLTGVVDGTTTLTANATVLYELATPELTNLTEQGLVTGELMSYANGTCYNSSDTFHSSDVSFDVPINTGAVISGLVESAEYQAKQIKSEIDSKGVANGIATLDATGNVPLSELGNVPPAPVQSVASKTGDVVLGKDDVGLGNVDNTSDIDKPISTATQTALDAKANLASPTFTGTVSGITKAMVGLENVSNDAQMPIAGGTFTGIATAQNNTSYTTKQIRNITISTADPTGGSNGDIWLKYQA